MIITELLFTHDKLLSLHLAENKIDHDGIIDIFSVQFLTLSTTF
jgi:hypothetical protein